MKIILQRVNQARVEVNQKQIGEIKVGYLLAEKLYHKFIKIAEKEHQKVKSGRFGAKMQVFLQNDGPVTLILNSKELFPALYQ